MSSMPSDPKEDEAAKAAAKAKEAEKAAAKTAADAASEAAAQSMVGPSLSGSVPDTGASLSAGAEAEKSEETPPEAPKTEKDLETEAEKEKKAKDDKKEKLTPVMDWASWFKLLDKIVSKENWNAIQAEAIMRCENSTYEWANKSEKKIKERLQVIEDLRDERERIGKEIQFLEQQPGRETALAQAREQAKGLDAQLKGHEKIEQDLKKDLIMVQDVRKKVKAGKVRDAAGRKELIKQIDSGVTTEKRQIARFHPFNAIANFCEKRAAKAAMTVGDVLGIRRLRKFGEQHFVAATSKRALRSNIAHLDHKVEGSKGLVKGFVHGYLERRSWKNMQKQETDQEIVLTDSLALAEGEARLAEGRSKGLDKKMEAAKARAKELEEGIQNAQDQQTKDALLKDQKKNDREIRKLDKEARKLQKLSASIQQDKVALQDKLKKVPESAKTYRETNSAGSAIKVAGQSYVRRGTVQDDPKKDTASLGGFVREDLAKSLKTADHAYREFRKVAQRKDIVFETANVQLNSRQQERIAKVQVISFLDHELKNLQKQKSSAKDKAAIDQQISDLQVKIGESQKQLAVLEGSEQALQSSVAKLKPEKEKRDSQLRDALEVRNRIKDAIDQEPATQIVRELATAKEKAKVSADKKTEIERELENATVTLASGDASVSEEQLLRGVIQNRTEQLKQATREARKDKEAADELEKNAPQALKNAEIAQKAAEERTQKAVQEFSDFVDDNFKPEKLQPRVRTVSEIEAENKAELEQLQAQHQEENRRQEAIAQERLLKDPKSADTIAKESEKRIVEQMAEEKRLKEAQALHLEKVKTAAQQPKIVASTAQPVAAATVTQPEATPSAPSVTSPSTATVTPTTPTPTPVIEPVPSTSPTPTPVSAATTPTLTPAAVTTPSTSPVAAPETTPSTPEAPSVSEPLTSVAATPATATLSPSPQPSAAKEDNKEEEVQRMAAEALKRKQTQQEDKEKEERERTPAASVAMDAAASAGPSIDASSADVLKVTGDAVKAGAGPGAEALKAAGGAVGEAMTPDVAKTPDTPMAKKDEKGDKENQEIGAAVEAVSQIMAKPKQVLDDKKAQGKQLGLMAATGGTSALAGGAGLEAGAATSSTSSLSQADSMKSISQASEQAKHPPAGALETGGNKQTPKYDKTLEIAEGMPITNLANKAQKEPEPAPEPGSAASTPPDQAALNAGFAGGSGGGGQKKKPEEEEEERAKRKSTTPGSGMKQ